MSDTAITVITPTEAKARALKIIEDNKDCVSYVRPEDLETAALFVPVVSAIRPIKDDFYEEIPKIGYMPKPRLVNLIREKAGVNIIRTETSKRGEFIWVAHAYGEKRMPDGSMAPQDASFEWDAQLRAEMDFLRQPTVYNTEAKKRLHVLEYAKIGESRAVTGAQHVLIHKLALVARSFKTPQEMVRGMLVSRVDRNVDGLLRDPQMRQAAIDHALGASAQIYGPRDVTPAKAQIAAPAEPAPDDGSGFDDAEQPPFAQPEPKPDERKPLRDQLAAILADAPKRDLLSRKKDKATGASALDLISGAVADEAATVESLQGLLERCAKMFGAKAGAA